MNKNEIITMNKEIKYYAITLIKIIKWKDNLKYLKKEQINIKIILRIKFCSAWPHTLIHGSIYLLHFLFDHPPAITNAFLYLLCFCLPTHPFKCLSIFFWDFIRAPTHPPWNYAFLYFSGGSVRAKTHPPWSYGFLYFLGVLFTYPQYTTISQYLHAFLLF